MHYVLYNTLSANKQGLEYSRLLLGNSVPEDAKMVELYSKHYFVFEQIIN